MIHVQGLQSLGCAYGEPIFCFMIRFFLYGILHDNGFEALKFGSMTKLCRQTIIGSCAYGESNSIFSAFYMVIDGSLEVLVSSRNCVVLNFLGSSRYQQKYHNVIAFQDFLVRKANLKLVLWHTYRHVQYTWLVIWKGKQDMR